MHEDQQRSRVLRKYLGESQEAEEGQPFSKERQHTAQALTLHVDYRDGRSNEGVGWPHFGRYKWVDRGDEECLRILFGEMCGMEIIGHNLRPLVAEVREGKLNGVREMLSSEGQLAVQKGTDEPVITSVRAYPDFDSLFEEVKSQGEEYSHGHQKHVGRARGR